MGSKIWRERAEVKAKELCTKLDDDVARMTKDSEDATSRIKMFLERQEMYGPLVEDIQMKIQILNNNNELFKKLVTALKSLKKKVEEAMAIKIWKLVFQVDY